MSIGAAGSDCRGLESVEDQVSTDVRNVVQASESDLMARGVAVDLLQMAKRVGPQYEASSSMIEGAIKPFDDGTVELSMKAPMSLSKPADLG